MIVDTTKKEPMFGEVFITNDATNGALEGPATLPRQTD